MGCGISRLDRQQTMNNIVQERGMHQRTKSEEEDMISKEKERLSGAAVEKVNNHGKEPDRRQNRHRGGGRHGDHFEDNDEKTLSDSDNRDDNIAGAIHCPRSPSFREYCIDSDDDSTDDLADKFSPHQHETPVESPITNKGAITIISSSSEAEGDDLVVKKERKGRSPSRIKFVLNKAAGNKQSRIRSYLNVSNWHSHNNPISSSQQNHQKLVAGS